MIAKKIDEKEEVENDLFSRRYLDSLLLTSTKFVQKLRSLKVLEKNQIRSHSIKKGYYDNLIKKGQ